MGPLLSRSEGVTCPGVIAIQIGHHMPWGHHYLAPGVMLWKIRHWMRFWGYILQGPYFHARTSEQRSEWKDEWMNNKQANRQMYSVGGRNPCSVESSFDAELSGKWIKNVTICYPKYESLICLIKSMNSICLEIYKWKTQFPCKWGKLAGSSMGHRDCIHLCVPQV
jgi:hypothetical protein